MNSPIHAAVPLALDIKNLRKSFGRFEVLSGISLSAHEGDVVSILGSSGSGKSTLLRCINLLEVPDSGDVGVGNELIQMTRGRDGKNRPADQIQVARIRSQLGMVFQSFNLWSHKTVLENVTEAPIHVQKRKRSEALEEAEALLAKVGITDKRNYYPSQLRRSATTRGHCSRTGYETESHVVR